MTLVDLLLLALFLLFALISWRGAALGGTRERRRDGGTPPRAPYGGTPRAPRDEIATGRPARGAPPPAAQNGAPSPTGGSDAGAGTRAPRRMMLRNALRHRGSLRQAFALAEILDRRLDRDG
ncbi:uncharacterized protein SOCE26_034940 [Sorangium cellulosum]|uniref:Uncharacterized protein n=1 Tax=Sorangium cellulosum TaxID=56 RepID=A0A2L0ERX1_SORCE|nr:hypothetical protein [Sorangium cellulosum]AUX42067.1 uncharacterized protein SOCE26_034940 [Sorangium cellulosum]